MFKMLIRILNIATTEPMGYGMVSFFVCFGSRRDECNRLWEGKGEKSENSCLLERYIRCEMTPTSRSKNAGAFLNVQKIIFFYNDKFIMYSDSMRYHLIISET